MFGSESALGGRGTFIGDTKYLPTGSQQTAMVGGGNHSKTYNTHRIFHTLHPRAHLRSRSYCSQTDLTKLLITSLACGSSELTPGSTLWSCACRVNKSALSGRPHFERTPPWYWIVCCGETHALKSKIIIPDSMTFTTLLNVLIISALQRLQTSETKPYPSNQPLLFHL